MHSSEYNRPPHRKKIRVLAFGTFDPLHEGHKYFFAKARALGNHLTIVVARDSYIRVVKHREPHNREEERLSAVNRQEHVNTVLLGDTDPYSYALLRKLDFDVLALGYDQDPSDHEVKNILQNLGKPRVRFVRLSALSPRQYKSTNIRERRDTEKIG